MKRHSYLQLPVKRINNGENSRAGLDPLQLVLAREQQEELPFGFWPPAYLCRPDTPFSSCHVWPSLDSLSHGCGSSHLIL
ncbi:hypothetical protein QQF64_027702 [Cirrhinus molitorella]|uniref:Uncharacterized protein n=1 Tax=Cirrhinus molitorella TaxID=172907 RepID=A0ABR3ND48_9TELE